PVSGLSAGGHSDAAGRTPALAGAQRLVGDVSEFGAVVPAQAATARHRGDRWRADECPAGPLTADHLGEPHWRAAGCAGGIRDEWAARRRARALRDAHGGYGAGRGERSEPRARLHRGERGRARTPVAAPGG